MSTHVDADDIALTRGERLLAVVLAAFLLVGGVWAYAQLAADEPPYPTETLAGQLTAPQRDALSARHRTRSAAATADRRVQDRRSTLEERREEYRTSLDADRRDPGLEQAYRRAQTRYASARRTATERRSAAVAAQSAVAPVDALMAKLERERSAAADAARRHDERVAAAQRLALVLVTFGGALVLLVALRRRRSRRIVIGYAAVGATTGLALVMAGDYLSDWFDPVDLGPLAIAAVGTAFTVAAIVVLQRQIARRLPGRRVRRGECPFCGFPVGRGDHCEGCGRDVQAPCSRCTAPRRVGTAHCAACGGT